MKYMILMAYEGPEGVPPLNEWAPEDQQGHFDYQRALGEELRAKGEFVDAQGLAWPDDAKLVTHHGEGDPVVTDGPFPEAKEFLAGYWMVDVADEARAIEIAARSSAAPGPAGKPLGNEIEVRALMEVPANPE